MKFLPLKIAVASLKRNKVRTLLTILGIVIGIMSVITVMSAGSGLQSYVTGQIEKFGTDAIQVEVKVPNTSQTSADNAGSMAQGVTITTLTLEDAQAMKKVPNIKNNYASLIGMQVLSYQDMNKQVMLWGTTASYNDVDTVGLEGGRFFTDEEDKSLAQLAIIGQTVKTKFFGDKDPIGQSIKIGREKFVVVGIMNKRGSIVGFDLDNMVYLPIRTLQKKIMGVDYVLNILNQTYDKSRADETSAELVNLLRERHNITDPKKDDFAVMSMAEALNIYNTIFGAINLLLAAIAGISLVVGGVGIMNIMYVSVTERTYEIGLRKSFGATGRNILWQFLWEAIVMTLFGAILGLIFGIGLSYLISLVAISQGLGWKFVVSSFSVLLAVGVSFFIGIVFGVFPAISAAKLDPVTALRSQK